MKTDRFDLVTAAHHFLIDVLPFREPESTWALAVFVETITRSSLSPVEIDAILLRCLVVLNEHAPQRIPSLVERYLADQSGPPDVVARFSRCIENILRYRGITHGSVQQALDLVQAKYADPELTPKSIACALNLRLSTLGVAFKRQTGCTLRQEIRTVRLGRAAALLAASNKTIKEVWSEVGYNHPSNFDHDFKQQFKMSPREYRGLALRPAVTCLRALTAVAPAPHPHVAATEARVLIVDDDEGTRLMVGHYLTLKGYMVFDADCGQTGLQEIERLAPDAILLDYRLTDMDGLEFLRVLRGRPTGHTPAVALFTADWDISESTRGVRELDAQVVSKLCDLNLVGELVSSLVLKSRVVRTGSTQ